jgi:hypothetical protein
MKCLNSFRNIKFIDFSNMRNLKNYVSFLSNYNLEGIFYETQKHHFSNNFRNKENISKFILDNRLSFSFAFSCIGFAGIGYPQFSLMSALGAFYYYYKNNESLRIKCHNFIDNKFTNERNGKILNSLE